MKAKQVRKFEQRLRALDITIPVPFDAGKFCEHIAQRRGRPIHILSLDTTDATAPCGLWLATPKADYIALDESAPPMLRNHILLHELAHMLCDHTGGLDLPLAPPTFSFLDPEVVKRVLGRTSRYPDEQEREAEGLASVITQFAARRSPVARPASPTDHQAAELDRVSAALAADRNWQ